jgi:NAD(P)-dependent dehydrogenase (short-subunit alcohol dehydrogenase family)
MISQSPRSSNLSQLASHRGTIVNVASVAGHCIIPTTSHYVASKHAVVAMTRSDALKYSQTSIRINCCSPGAVWTPLVTEAGLPQEFLDMGAAQAPMKRYVEANEVANAVVFLASDEKASAITGINLSVDCGTQLLRTI